MATPPYSVVGEDMNVKPTRAIGDYCRGFATEDGKNYRVERQDIAPTLDHVKFLSEKVNTAPKSGNKNEWSYLGSIPKLVLSDWLKNNHYTWDQYARNEDFAKEKFLKWVRREAPKLLAPKKKASQILMPR